jgi:hypothetical protein
VDACGVALQQQRQTLRRPDGEHDSGENPTAQRHTHDRVNFGGKKSPIGGPVRRCDGWQVGWNGAGGGTDSD